MAVQIRKNRLVRLSEGQRQFAKKHYLLGYGVAPIAQELGIGVVRLKRYVANARLSKHQQGGIRVKLPPLPAFTGRKKTQAKKPNHSSPSFRSPPELATWNRPIVPGWKVHGEVRYRGESDAA